MYNSLVSDEYNAKTIELLNSDPHCQAAIAMKALNLGIHSKSVTDSMSLGGAETQDKLEQAAGCAGRDESVLTCRIIMTTTTELSKAKKIAECLYYSSLSITCTHSITAAAEISISAIAKLKPSLVLCKSKKPQYLDPVKLFTMWRRSVVLHVEIEFT